MRHPGVVPEVVGVVAGVAMGADLVSAMVENRGPVVIPHVAVGADLLASDLTERRFAAAGSGH